MFRVHVNIFITQKHVHNCIRLQQSNAAHARNHANTLARSHSRAHSRLHTFVRVFPNLLMRRSLPRYLVVRPASAPASASPPPAVLSVLCFARALSLLRTITLTFSWLSEGGAGANSRHCIALLPPNPAASADWLLLLLLVQLTPLGCWA